MLQAFFDESRYDDDFIVAGWVADDSEWAALSEKWSEQLAASPSIQYFKHSEAKRTEGQFANWLRRDIERKIESMVSVLCARKMYGVYTRLSIKTFEAAFAGAVVSRRVLRTVLKATDHYQWSVFGLTSVVLQIQNDRFDKR